MAGCATDLGIASASKAMLVSEPSTPWHISVVFSPPSDLAELLAAEVLPLIWIFESKAETTPVN